METEWPTRLLVHFDWQGWALWGGVTFTQRVAVFCLNICGNQKPLFRQGKSNLRLHKSAIVTVLHHSDTHIRFLRTSCFLLIRKRQNHYGKMFCIFNTSANHFLSFSPFILRTQSHLLPKAWAWNLSTLCFNLHFPSALCLSERILCIFSGSQAGVLADKDFSESIQSILTSLWTTEPGLMSVVWGVTTWYSCAPCRALASDTNQIIGLESLLLRH